MMSHSWLIFPFTAATILLFTLRPNLGICVLLFELILGGNGRWFEFYEYYTPRYILIFSLVIGCGLRAVYLCKPTYSDYLRKPIVIIPLLIFYGVLIIGVVHGFLEGNQELLKDVQVWIYLALSPVIVASFKKVSFSVKIVRLFLLCGVILAIIQIALTITANLYTSQVWDLYYLIEPMGIRISPIANTNIVYTFMSNSAIYGYVLSISLLLLLSKKGQTFGFESYQLYFFSFFVILASITSMSRGSWAQTLLTLFIVLISVWRRKSIRQSAPLIIWFLVLCSLIFGILFSKPDWKDAFVERTSMIFTETNDIQDSNDSFVVKANEFKNGSSALWESPLIGYGFGLGRYSENSNINQIYFHNSYLQFSLKAGLIGLFVLLILFFTILWRAFRTANLSQNISPEYSLLLRGMAYGLIGSLLATLSNPHMTTPLFVVSLALLMAFTEQVKCRCVLRAHSLYNYTDKNNF